MDTLTKHSVQVVRYARSVGLNRAGNNLTKQIKTMNEKQLAEMQDGSLVKYNGELLGYDNGIWFKILYALNEPAISKYNLDNDDHKKEIAKIQPVRLDEKFTINGEEVYVWQVLGFKKRWGVAYYTLSLNVESQLYFKSDYVFKDARTGRAILINNTLTPCKYAHQVQALYRVLTGKPLKLEIPKSK